MHHQRVHSLTDFYPWQTRIELEQGNYPKPPAWLTGAGDVTAAPSAAPQPAFDAGSFQIGGMNPYAGDFHALDPQLQAMLEKMTATATVSKNESSAQFSQPAVNQEAWMQEQDRLLESMVASAMGKPGYR